MSVFYIWFVQVHLSVIERTSYWLSRLTFYKPCQLIYYWQQLIEWTPIHPYIFIHQSKNGRLVYVACYSFVGDFLYWNWSHIILKNQKISTVWKIYWYQIRLIINIDILKQTYFNFNKRTIDILSKGKIFYWRLNYCY